MERRLFIIRHGKSSWDHEGLADIHRPLSDRGVRNAVTMAERLKERNMIPELLLSSPAARALYTALIMSRTWALSPEALQIHEEIYEASARDLDEVLGTVPATVTSVALFGHNPTFTLYANRFLDQPLNNLPTAGVVVVTLESEGWSDPGKRRIVETYVDYPKKKP
ncbi:MAG: SixA phosphatase family protein [Bacteroidales bacterium]